MRRANVSVVIGALFFFSACRKDDQLQTYRVSKEAGPAMPLAQMPAAPPSGEAPMGAAGNDGGGMDMNAGESAPPASGGMDMNAMGAGAGMTAAATPQEISWKVPGGWVVQPPSAMRVGSFLVKGENGQTADVSVIPLSGEAGGDLANINRWRGQINLPPISEEDLPRNSQTITPAGRRMRLVEFVSAEPLMANRYKKRLIAAIYTKGERSWFFKMLGEDATVRAAKPSFLQFLRSLHFATE